MAHNGVFTVVQWIICWWECRERSGLYSDDCVKGWGYEGAFSRTPKRSEMQSRDIQSENKK